MRVRLAFLMAAAAIVSAEPAWACDRGYRNMFADYGSTPGADLLKTARYIDWIEVVAPDPPGCARDRRLTEEEWAALDTADAKAAETGSIPPPEPEPRTADGYRTRSCWNGKATTSFRALRGVVVESIRGGATGDFPLAWSWEPNEAPEMAYSDPRTLVIEADKGLRDQYDSALTSHGEPGFNDHGELTRQIDGTDSCGGVPTAIIGARYLAFRSASGNVLALEPVSDRDDVWFRRVRSYADRPTDFSRPELDIADFLRASMGAAVVRLKRCGRDRYGSSEVAAEVLRGGFDAGWMTDTVVTQVSENASEVGPRKDGPSFNWLADYLKKIGVPCRPGVELLVLSGPFDRAGESPPRAARISRGQVLISDFISGYRLGGADKISVDQAFAWVEEGRASRGEVH